MRKTKRTVTLLLSIMFILGMLPLTVLASPIAEIESVSWAKDSMYRWIDEGLLQGDGVSYKPLDKIARADFMAFVNRSFGFTDKADISMYTDVKAGDWFYDDVAIAVAAGYMNGKGDGLMGPRDNITRQEAMAIASRLAGKETADLSILDEVQDAGQISNWAVEEVAACLVNGLIAGNEKGEIAPLDDMTRAEAIVMLDRIIVGTRIFNFPGEFSVTAVNVEIRVDGVSLIDSDISGDLTICASVGDGDVSLTNVSVGGKLNVQGGGANSIHVINSSVASVVVTATEVRVVMEDGSVVTTAIVAGDAAVLVFEAGASVESLSIEAPGVSLSVAQGAVITDVAVSETGAGAAIELAEGSEVGNLSLGANTSVSGTGTVNEMKVTANDAQIELASVAVKTMVIDGGNTSVKLTGNVTVAELTVNENAGGSAINTDESTKITNITLNAKTTVSGEGTIDKAVVNVNEVVIEKKPEVVEVAPDVTADVGGEEVTDTTPTTPPPPPPTYYTVTFMNGTDTVGNPQTISGGTVPLPAPPTTDSYVFYGWFTSAGTEFTASTPVTGNITVNARWIVNVASATDTNITSINNNLTDIAELAKTGIWTAKAGAISVTIEDGDKTAADVVDAITTALTAVTNVQGLTDFTIGSTTLTTASSKTDIAEAVITAMGIETAFGLATGNLSALNGKSVTLAANFVVAQGAPTTTFTFTFNFAAA